MNIFVNYRREDSSGHSGRLYDRLRMRFGINAVFMDTVSIKPGENWEDAIVSAVSSCKVLLAVIGPQWVHVVDSAGKRRLDNPGDFVRFEIKTALAHGIPVIPITINETKMPPSNELPEDIAGITRFQAVELTDKSFDNDIRQLFAAIQSRVGREIGKSILIIDDDIALASSISDLLRFHGYTVYTTYDLEPGLEFARRHRLDAILIEVFYLRRSSDERRNSAFVELKQLASEAKIIAVTVGNASQTSIDQCDYAIAKPMDEEQLLDLLQTALG
ncbi:MAG: TIR domain-containing protein [Anaerolineae bacterium]|nr:TIR domain-containing protein [Anaerolineae bacterium]